MYNLGFRDTKRRKYDKMKISSITKKYRIYEMEDVL